MIDRNTFEQILHFHWYNWTIGKYAYLDYDTYSAEYLIWHRVENSHECVLDEHTDDKSDALTNFLLLDSYKRFSTPGDVVGCEVGIIGRDEISFTE